MAGKNQNITMLFFKNTYSPHTDAMMKKERKMMFQNIIVIITKILCCFFVFVFPEILIFPSTSDPPRPFKSKKADFIIILFKKKKDERKKIWDDFLVKKKEKIMWKYFLSLLKICVSQNHDSHFFFGWLHVICTNDFDFMCNRLLIWIGIWTKKGKKNYNC